MNLLHRVLCRLGLHAWQGYAVVDPIGNGNVMRRSAICQYCRLEHPQRTGGAA